MISVGSCDGSSDKLLKMYYRNQHWKGILIEGNLENVKIMESRLRNESAVDRSLVLPVAMMGTCQNETVEFASPKIEAFNPNAKHWMRRQVGRVVRVSRNRHKDITKDRKWKIDRVKCMTAADVYEKWNEFFGHKKE
jgi:hypothetical protein